MDLCGLTEINTFLNFNAYLRFFRETSHMSSIVIIFKSVVYVIGSVLKLPVIFVAGSLPVSKLL